LADRDKKCNMAVSYIDLNGSYQPKTEDENIEVEVQIGNGQSGSYAIFLGKVLKGANKPAVLGKKADIVDKNTVITVTITDLLEETNWTSMTVTVTEGKHKTEFGPYEKQVPHSMDTAIYTLKLVHQ
jgi:hypothetical protein